ncbi:basic leucine zipper 9-like [Malania oleifera]|uniref:basic leucine zipper 9-like n=1 Tax=Malania oleifera TaxID=397392 RepID=UPI0025AE643A|nr:basic leucine zipper 9-like [Malania oleifera]
MEEDHHQVLQGVTGELKNCPSELGLQALLMAPLDDNYLSKIELGANTKALPFWRGGDEGLCCNQGVETEAGPSERSRDPFDYKRLKRMASNRESARRSRQRKQQQQEELEAEVEQLKREHASLSKHFSNLKERSRDAWMENRLLKADVEALKAMRLLDEERRAARHCQTCHVGGGHASSVRMYVSGQNSTPGMQNFNAGINNGVMGDAVRCATDTHPPPNELVGSSCNAQHVYDEISSVWKEV